jgi:hypothetical protein
MACSPEMTESAFRGWKVFEALGRRACVPGKSDRRAAIIQRLATAPIRRSHSSRLPRKPSSQAVLKLSRAINTKAAEHHEHAAKHHRKAAEHHGSGKHETAAHHAHAAHGHHLHATHHASEAAKRHVDLHGHK